MSDTYLPGLMELDSFWENAVRDAVEDTIHDRKRLEFALENRSKINKRLKSLGNRTAPRRKKCAKRVYAEEDGEDDVSEADSLNESDSADSMGDDLGMEAVRNRKRGPKPRGKVNKIKRSHLEFVHEPMDTKYDNDDEDEDDDGDSEDYEEETNCPRISHLKQSPYEQAKKKLSVMITEMKRKKKGEKKSKSGKKRSKSGKSKDVKNKLDKKAGYGKRKERKNEIQGKVKSEVNKEGVTITPGAAANKDAVKSKEGNQDGTREVVGDKKEGQNHVSTGKESSKNGTGKEAEPKESDFRCDSMSESGQSCWSESVLGDDDFS